MTGAEPGGSASEAGAGADGAAPRDDESLVGAVRTSLPEPTEAGWVFLVGLFMGAADGVPGVSGGTVALIAGVYERLIDAVTAVTPRRLGATLGAVVPLDGDVSGKGALEQFLAVDGWFLISLLAGIATAVVTVTGIVSWAADAVPTLLFGILFGLIGASAVVLFRAIQVREPDEIVATVVGVVLAFVVSGQAASATTQGLAIVFVAGALAISAMILPGISGSLLLVMLGQYERMSDALHAFIGAIGNLTDGGSLANVVDAGVPVVVFIGGGLVGLFTLARAIRVALQRNRTATLAFLVALVLGALRAPIVRLGTKDGVAWTTATMGEFGAAALVGAVVVFALEWYAVDLDLTPAEE